LLAQGDVLVVNDTRVLPARLFGTDAEGRRTELLLAARRAEAGAEVWECLARPGRRAKAGRVFDVGAGVRARVVEKTGDGRYVIAFEGRPLAEALDTIGSAPLPPYIHRPGGVADARDASDYQ